jgi:hypothetical protein
VNSEEREKEIEKVKAEIRAAIEHADAVIEKFDREAPIRTVTTALAFQRLRESARRP